MKTCLDFLSVFIVFKRTIILVNIFWSAGPYSVKDKGQQKRQSDLPVFQQCQRAMICSPWPLRLHIHAIINRYLVSSRFVSTRISLLLILENRWSYRYFRTPLVGINIIFKLTWLRCDHLFWRARLSLHELASLIASTHQYYACILWGKKCVRRLFCNYFLSFWS